MIKTADLTERAVREFVEAFNEGDKETLRATVSPVFASSAGDLDDLLRQFTAFVPVKEQNGGLSLTGLATQTRMTVPVKWSFTVEYGRVGRLEIEQGADMSGANGREALTELRERIPARAAEALFARSHDADGRTHPAGTARRMRLGEHLFVHTWTVTGRGSVDWVITSEKADDDTYRSLRSPASGHHDDRGGGPKLVSSVSSHLGLALGWDGAGYQKATVSFWAKPYYWEAVKWNAEYLNLSHEYIPQLTGTLTLTGPSGAVVSSESVTVSGGKVPYEMEFSREFALGELPTGTYTLTFADAWKKGGTWANKRHDQVHLKDHALAFDIGA
ncbi:hypothetical protein ACFVFH_05380 [Streptomyces sp. NPDC057697]|uniref:hypothetical protein n=1 Tax=Streptomyces sp. NPDC057697 TaxID=3346219 RepID=UPI0036BE44C1